MSEALAKNILGEKKVKCNDGRATLAIINVARERPNDYNLNLTTQNLIFLVFLFAPDMTGVDLAEEDARFMEYLESNGWEGAVGDDEDMNLIGTQSLPDGRVVSSTVLAAMSKGANETASAC